jgi:hypothetical protein
VRDACEGVPDLPLGDLYNLSAHLPAMSESLSGACPSAAAGMKRHGTRTSAKVRACR